LQSCVVANQDESDRIFREIFLKGDRVEIIDLLHGIELFDGLTEVDLEEVAVICKRRQLKKGEFLAKQGDIGKELFIVSDGLVEVSLHESETPHVVINLGSGQLIGEMSLVDRGPRSATVKAVHDPTIVQVIQYDDFKELCERNAQIGYRVMLNLAVDLSFKLRHSNLSEH
jgi:CRP-like cAMP-binding protein